MPLHTHYPVYKTDTEQIQGCHMEYYIQTYLAAVLLLYQKISPHNIWNNKAFKLSRSGVRGRMGCTIAQG